MARKKKTEISEPTVYTYEQLQKIEDHIEKHFGQIENYLQESDTDDIKLNIYALPPTVNNRCLTLVTAGMGALEMKVPDELEDNKLSRCELVMTLPPDWDIHGEELENVWPLHLLKLISRLPIKEKSWLGPYHTIDYGTCFASNTEFTSIMIMPVSEDMDVCRCELPDGEIINFYRVFPLYNSELEFKCLNGSGALLDKFDADYDFMADIERSPVVTKDFLNIIDTVESHSSKIEQKQLDTPMINGANHISAYFRWIMEHNMLNDEFIDFFEEEIAAIKQGKADIRKFIINSLGGEFLMDMLNDEGAAFADYYYNFYHGEDEPCFPGDVDNVAMDFFGEEKYNCEEFGNEAYLFVPYDESYYKAMCRYINRNYKKFLKEKEQK
ncbi:MAG: suppressor of fused domain protein [Ruminococcus sp.]|nr:suppressor of fused domain protein [Ruminococcus sp.]